MQSFRKSIEYYQDDKYRDLPYGTIYYVAGTLSPYIDNLFRENIPVFINHLNQLTNNYLTCNIVYLEPKNDLFKTKYVSAFYSPILPTRINYAKGHSFFVATIENCNPEELEEALMKYYSTLLEIFDAILDHGSFPADLIYDHLRPQIEFTGWKVGNIEEMVGCYYCGTALNTLDNPLTIIMTEDIAYLAEFEAQEEGIEHIVLTEKAKKVVVDGVIYIVRDGKLFDLTGAQVK